jgi:hypothetical protein
VYRIEGGREDLKMNRKRENKEEYTHKSNDKLFRSNEKKITDTEMR